MAETIAAIVAAHRAGTMTPVETVARSYARIRALDDPAVFISLREEKDAIADARALTGSGGAERPLYGVPFAVKDNIDVAGIATTNACPAFTYHPAHDATSVARLRKAGAIVIGKTNLDQFATGLVGAALALRRTRAICSTPSSFPAARARAPASPSAPASCRWRSAPTPPAPAACRRASTISSA